MLGLQSNERRGRPLGRSALPPGQQASPAARLRALLAAPRLARVAGAHNALGARLAERAGFDAVWSSGLEVSASHALPDADILTMPELLAVAQSMVTAIDIPVIADCDAGYGNSNNVIHMVRRYEAAGIAAVCIEDKSFPKRNSFAPGRQELASVPEFVGKLMAAKAAQRSPELVVVARVEALIAGHDVDEALRRAHAYAEAGADAVLIHDRAPTAARVLEFAARWGNRLPVVVVPTTYHSITAADLAAAGVSVVIYANHGLRAGIAAVQRTFAEILARGTTTTVEPEIAPMSLVFELQGLPQLQRDERAFLPAGNPAVRAVVLAAGDHLGAYSMREIAGEVPMAMLDINGKTLLRRQIEAMAPGGVCEVVVVTGHRAQEVAADGARTVVNERWQSTGEVASLLCAGDSDHHTLVIYGDVLCDSDLVRGLLQAEGDVTVIVDTSHAGGHPTERTRDLVSLVDPPTRGRRRMYARRECAVARIGSRVDAQHAQAEFAGIALLSPKGLELVREAYAALGEAGAGHGVSLPDVLQMLIDAGHAVQAVDMPSGWMEIASFDDYRLACDMTAP